MHSQLSKISIAIVSISLVVILSFVGSMSRHAPLTLMGESRVPSPVSESHPSFKPVTIASMHQEIRAEKAMGLDQALTRYEEATNRFDSTQTLVLDLRAKIQAKVMRAIDPSRDLAADKELPELLAQETQLLKTQQAEYQTLESELKVVTVLAKAYAEKRLERTEN